MIHSLVGGERVLLLGDGGSSVNGSGKKASSGVAVAPSPQPSLAHSDTRPADSALLSYGHTDNQRTQHPDIQVPLPPPSRQGRHPLLSAPLPSAYGDQDAVCCAPLAGKTANVAAARAAVLQDRAGESGEAPSGQPQQGSPCLRIEFDEKLVRAALEENPVLSVEELAVVLSSNHTTVHRHLEKLGKVPSLGNDGDFAEQVNESQEASSKPLYPADGDHPHSLLGMHQKLALWCTQQTDAIKRNMSPGKERTLALSALLTQETAMLRRLHEQQVKRGEQAAALRINDFLDAASQPQRWRVSGGGYVTVHTPNSGPLAHAAAVAKQLLCVCSTADRLQQLHKLASARMTAAMPHTLVCDVITAMPHTLACDVITTAMPHTLACDVKTTAMPHTLACDVVYSLQAGRGDENAVCSLKSTLTGLVSRALQLLQRGSHDAALTGLRKRIHSHLLQLLHLGWLLSPLGAGEQLPCNPTRCTSSRRPAPSLQIVLLPQRATAPNLTGCQVLNDLQRTKPIVEEQLVILAIRDTFCQDGATTHTAQVAMVKLRQMVPARLVSRRGDVEWPPRSPDFIIYDFFPWGYLKEKVFRSRPHNLEELKMRIREEIVAMPLEMCRRAI
ncbi:hypothetical protein FHG87_016209 [Trinorchestia longiramus]|nr:hypothetical protein FHG87_016209 [Trinorchestia longiramus]